MADLTPIKPLFYNPEVVGDLSAVITPPYDVMSPEEQQAYRERSPYSAIHIELPLPADGLDPYQHAARVIERWESEGVLVPGPGAAMFVHQQVFTVHDHTYSRTALLAGVRLEPWEAGVVIPHEHTLRGPKQDRLALLRATALAPSSIFGLYEQPRAVGVAVDEITSVAPWVTAVADGVTHNLWVIEEPAVVRQIVDAMRDQRIYIADGHHRYETALAYRDERRRQDGNDPDEAFNFVAMSLVSFDDPGLVVLPTHRLVSGVDAARLQSLPQALQQRFSVMTRESGQPTEQEIASLLTGNEPYLFVIYDGRTLWRVSGGPEVAAALPQDRSAAWRSLDLAVVHGLVLGGMLGIGPDQIEADVRYTRDVSEAVRAVRGGAAQLAIFVRPTPVSALRAVADAGDKMPQKSTYFYPKFPAGLVMNQLDVKLPVPEEARP